MPLSRPTIFLVKPGRRRPWARPRSLSPSAARLKASFRKPRNHAHSALLEIDKLATLKFRVPSEPGIYPYVCTFPGHAPVMFGALDAGCRSRHLPKT